MIKKVSIRLKTNVYSSFRALPNKPAMAIAEFVDNAIASYEQHKERLRAVNNNYQFRVEITLSSSEIVVKDNASGILETDYTRAFEPANIPINNKGLNEFGMGLKTAAIWLADNWSVQSKALGEVYERTISFDLNEVLKKEKEELLVENKEREENLHYTIIRLHNLSENISPYTGSKAKISQHLGSIYRKYVRSGELHLTVNDKVVEAPHYENLVAPFVHNPEGDAREWVYPIHFDGGKYKAKGFIGVLKQMKLGANGLVILRRGRAIMGATDERFFHKSIFGSVGSPEYKRLYGELEIEGFDVNFNKSQITQSKDLEWLLEEIAREIKSKPENIIVQANKYRQRSKQEIASIAAQVSTSLKKEDKAPLKLAMVTPSKEERVLKEKPAEEIVTHDIDTLSFKYNNKDSILETEVYQDPSDLCLYKLKEDKNHRYTCCVNLAHPYMQSDLFAKNNGNKFLTHLIVLIRNLALAELRSGERISEAGTVRQEFNRIMRSYENDD